MSHPFEEVKLDIDDKREIKNNRTGKILLAVSIVLIIIGCAASAGWLAPFAIIGFLVGVFMIILNKSEYQIRQEKALAQSTANLWAAKVKAGQKIDVDDTPVARAAQQKKETKEIIKGAVVGSIVAGDAGAVVGATIAKNKIDNEKKK